jgi:hypothetical protein
MNSGGFLFMSKAAGMNSKRRCHLNSGKNLRSGGTPLNSTPGSQI